MSKKLPADFPETAADWASVIAAAPGEDTPQAQAAVDEKLTGAVVIPAGAGPLALREALVRRTRGPGKRQAKVPTTLRLPAETLAGWRATGPGWQTRMAEALTRALLAT